MMNFPRFISSAAILLSFPVALHSAEDRRQQNAAYQAGVEQEQLRAQTRRLVAQISTMLEQFRKNSAATEEVALTETTLKNLQSLSDKDMAAVVLAMQDVSKSPKASDTTAKIIAASKTAKDVQINLARLADKLALYQSEASIELRLTALLRRQLTNQRQARYLAQGIIPAGEQDKEAQLTAVEQKAIAEESNDLLLSLQRLAANPASLAKAAFGAAYNAGVSGYLIPNSQSAASIAAAKDFPNAQIAQQKVVASLQTMLQAIASGKSLEERYRAAEQKMRALAAREQALARTTSKSGLPNLRAVTRRQQEVADQRSILELEVFTLSADTGPLLGQSRQTLDTLDDTFQKSPQVMDRPAEKVGVVTTQNDVATQFLAIADLLKKRADAVASANGSGPGKSDGDADRTAMTSAANSLINAITKMEMSQQILNQGGDADKAKSEMGKAQGDLSKAESELGKAPNAPTQGPGENIDKAQGDLGKGEEQASQGSGESRKDANMSVDGAKSAANQALADLKSALAAMSNKGGLAGQSSDPNQEQNPGASNDSGWGGLFRHTSDSSAYAAVATITARDRDALATLQKEKAPPEYDTMARQYMKNLADGVVPAQ